MEQNNKTMIVLEFAKSNAGRRMTSTEIREELLDMVTVSNDDVSAILSVDYKPIWDSEDERLVWQL